MILHEYSVYLLYTHSLMHSLTHHTQREKSVNQIARRAHSTHSILSSVYCWAYSIASAILFFFLFFLSSAVLWPKTLVFDTWCFMLKVNLLQSEFFFSIARCHHTKPNIWCCETHNTQQRYGDLTSQISVRNSFASGDINKIVYIVAWISSLTTYILLLRVYFNCNCLKKEEKD